jgi:hypothetical protein
MASKKIHSIPLDEKRGKKGRKKKKKKQTLNFIGKKKEKDG